MFYITNIEIDKDEYIVFGYDEDGKKRIIREPFIFELFVKDPNGEHFDIFKNSYRRLEFHNYNDVKECIKDYQNLSEVDKENIYSPGMNTNYAGDISPANYYIYKYFEKEGIINDNMAIQRYIHKTNSLLRTFYLDIEFYGESNLEDLTSSRGYINIITIFDTKTNNALVYGTKDWTPDDEYKEKEKEWGINRTLYKKFNSEKELLEAIAKTFSKLQPDIISGFYSDLYDMPMILLQAKKYGIKPADFSPIGKNSYLFEKEIYHKKEFRHKIAGIHSIDYIKLYKSMKLSNLPSYSLNYISDLELKESKLKMNSEVSQALVNSLNDFADKDWNNFVKYNIKDTLLIAMIDRKTDYMNIALGITLSNCSLLNTYESPVRVTDNLNYMFFKRMNKLVNGTVSYFDKKNIDIRDYTAGYVKTVAEGLKIGVYSNVVSFDVNSEYPTIIISYDMSYENQLTHQDVAKEFPDVYDYYTKKVAPLGEKGLFDDYFNEKGIIKKFQKMLKDNSLTFCQNGVFFRKVKRKEFSTVSSIYKKLYDDRVKIKNEMKKEKKGTDEYKILYGAQYLLKNAMNAATGVHASQYYRYCNVDFIEAVTTTGRLLINYLSDKLSKHIYKLFKDDYTRLGFKEEDIWIYTDTDSFYFNLEPVFKSKKIGESNKKFKAFVDIYCQKQINKFLDQYSKDWNCKINYLGLKRELICDKAIWIAGKNYLCHIINDDDGKDCDKVKIKGINLNKATTHPMISDKIKDEALPLIFNEEWDKLEDWLREYKKEFKKIPLDILGTSISMKASVNDYIVDGKPKKGCPLHVRGAIMYNNLIDDNGIKNLAYISEGSKIKHIYMKEKNFGSHVFSWIEPFPMHISEFEEIAKYVDYEKMWEKNVMDNINQILTPIGRKITDIDSKSLF